MAPDAARAVRHSAVARAKNSSLGIRAASQSDGPTSSVGCIVCISALSNCDLGERGLALRQRLGALRRQEHGLAAEQIAGLRQVLVGMDHEHHALLQHGVIVEADVAGPDRAEAESVAAAADVRGMAVL